MCSVHNIRNAHRHAEGHCLGEDCVSVASRKHVRAHLLLSVQMSVRMMDKNSESSETEVNFTTRHVLGKQTKH